MRLTDTLEVLQDKLDYQGQEVTVDLAFDVVLLVLEALTDEELEPYDKVWKSLDLLLPYFDRQNLTFEEECELLEVVFGEFIYEAPQGGQSQGTSSEKIMDYVKDADLLYASFFQAYHLDLFAEQGRLHWKKFQALVRHLHKDTPFKEVVGYRIMDIPKKNEASEGYIRHVRRMKDLYRLETEEEIQDSNDQALMALAAQYMITEEIQDG